MRNDATQAKSLADPVEYEKNLQLGREVTDVLRKNIARIVRDDKDQDLYSE